MPPISMSAMQSALGLTRAGDLTGATQLIKNMLSGAVPDPAPSGTGPIDLMPLAIAGPSAVVRPTISGNVAAPNMSSGRHSRHVFKGASGTLAYELYVPAGDAREMPLVIMLHGCTQSAKDFALGTRMNDLADEFAFAVAYPEQPAGANPQRCWNWFRSGDQKRDSGEPALIAGLTNEIAAAQAIDTSRIYIAGLSAGGAAAANIAAAYPDIYAAVGVHSGLACGAARDMPGAFAAMSGCAFVTPIGDQPFVPTITFHGGRDQTVRPINSAQIHGRLAGHKVLGGSRKVTERGASASGRSYVKDAMVDADGRSLAENWTIPDAGHAWSGGNGQGSYTDPSGPNSSREMVRFFLQHKLHRD